jgi:hypothetical protein
MQLRYLSLIRSSGLATALLLLLALRALGADVSPAPSAMPTMPPAPTNEQVVKFLDAMVYESKPNSGKIVIDVIDASKMPAYDPLAHYLGMPDGKTPTIQMVGHTSASDADAQKALSRAFSLAVMDDGEAGPYWKQLYDMTAAKDATLPSAAPDPYRYRHELADVADAILAANTPSGKNKSFRRTSR